MHCVVVRHKGNARGVTYNVGVVTELIWKTKDRHKVAVAELLLVLTALWSHVA
jgi:hypothetical protein